MFQPIIIRPIGVPICVAQGRETLARAPILPSKRLKIGEIGIHHAVVIDDVGARPQVIIKHESFAIVLGKWPLQVIILADGADEGFQVAV